MELSLMNYSTAIRYHGDEHGALAVMGIELCDGRLYEIWVTSTLRDRVGCSAVLEMMTKLRDLLSERGMNEYAGAEEFAGLARGWQLNGVAVGEVVIIRVPFLMGDLRGTHRVSAAPVLKENVYV